MTTNSSVSPNRIGAIFRLLRIVRVASKYGLSRFLKLGPGRFLTPVYWLLSLGGNKSGNEGVRIRLALEELGPVFVKFGQALSTRPDLLPDNIATELTALQDAVPPFDGAVAKKIVEASLGKPVTELFKQFDLKPFASASVAQVHLAKLANGTEVIVKVLRPDILPVIERDLRLLYTLAFFVNKYWDQGPRLRPVEVVKEYDNTIHNELDMRMEAANAALMKRNFKNSDLVYVPEVYWDFTEQDVLVMERIHGTPIRDIDTLKTKGIDMRKLAHDGVTIFFTQAFRDGFFHADMHPGNIFVGDNGQYRAVDFGIMGTLTDEDKRYLARNFIGFFNRDYRAVADAHIQAGWVPSHTRAEDFEAAIRTVCEPIFAKPISEISFGKFLLQLFQTAHRFEMPIQPQLALLQKTLLNIEGLGRQLYPQLDLWETAKPFLERWMDEQIGFAAFREKVRTEMPNWAQTLPELPTNFHGFLDDVRELRKYSAKQQLSLTSLNRQLERQERSRRRVWASSLVFITAAATLGLLFTGLLSPPAEYRDWWVYCAVGAMFASYVMILGKPR
ncbi:MAG: ubiquinone biosynthesis regulatory protein kinase UbiB [Proteobacteria bacterium]|jgi:ubiquinone biosynthesis protein|nr:ubiquinone biosynthesis regulatory protein kinase UbiB [Pseudomonadota bacterium]